MAMVGGKRGSVWLSRDEYPSEEAACAEADFDSCFEARTCHLSVYGRGQGSLIHKSISTNNIHLMESEDTEMHNHLVSEVYDVLADQGT